MQRFKSHEKQTLQIIVTVTEPNFSSSLEQKAVLQKPKVCDMHRSKQIYMHTPSIRHWVMQGTFITGVWIKETNTEVTPTITKQFPALFPGIS